MEKYKLPIPLPSAGINYKDDSLIGDNEAAEGTVNISFKNGMPRTRSGYVEQKLYTHSGSSGHISRLFVHTVDGDRKMVYARDHAEQCRLHQLDALLPTHLRILGDIETGKPSLIQFAGGFSGGAFSEKVLVLTGETFKYFDPSIALTAVPVYEPSEEDVTAFGTNVLDTTPDEINQQKWIIQDDNRFWVAGYGNLVRISHLGPAGGMPDYWPSTQAIKLPEDCTGMARYMGEVILFTENTATIVQGSTPLMSLDDSYRTKQLPGGYGCAQADTIAIGDNSLYWANRNGIYRYTYMPTGFSIPECVSEFVVQDDGGRRTRSIAKKLAEISDWSKVFAVFYDHEYRLYIGNGEVLCFDTIMGSWALYRYYHEFSSGCVYGNELYYGASKPLTDFARIYQMDYPFDPMQAGYDGLSDAGNAFEATLKSKFFDFGKSSNKKRFGRFYFTFFSELVTYDILLKVNMDNEVQVMTGAIEANKVSRWGNDDPEDDVAEAAYAFAFGDVIQSERTNLNYPVKLVHRGKRYNIQYELTTTGLNEAWLLKDVVLMLKVKELQ